ncbi:efflux transporter outer membrane subunit [Stakelama sediminis]|uniref:NodT family efflux transporter outer membrane factor (OMF) lipoprotein n=1 Tax=Stakelama sediminis TaxID=463200 RepID=A0A840YYW5_9SPHN|nr:efflux transporter outer membrane subunit [Stakelama sediminis]MBB5718729.1 NodT family efflux transporter outer membrane factor (OMF) lipoprotein [Stakelama sediminis]
MFRPRLLAAMIGATALAGCTVGPDYHAPDLPVPAKFAEAGAAASPANDVDLAHWWTAFGDPELNKLVHEAMSEGLDVQTAASRLRQARAAEAIAHAQYLPQINADAGGNYIHFSKNAGFSSLASLFSGGGSGSGNSGGVALPGDGIKTYSAGFDASWELDLFGGGRRSSQAAAARVGLAEWDARDVAVSLAAEVADNYLKLRTLQQQETVLRAEIARRERMDSLQAHRVQVGLTPETDQVRDQASLAQTRASLQPLLIQERIQMHALAVLLGKDPGALIAELSAPHQDVITPPAIPAGLPSELLRRRPDVRAAERKLAATTADVGVAVANLYPKISLTGAAQLISTALSNLFSTDSLQATAAAKAAFPILDFGKRRGEVKERQEERQQAYIAYRKTVLGALRDVDDALVRIQGERQRNKQLRVSVDSAERALHAVDAKYNVGLVDLSAVLQARGSLLNQQDALAQSNGTLQEATASLYKALGGGWDDNTLKQVEANQPVSLDGKRAQP